MPHPVALRRLRGASHGSGDPGLGIHCRSRKEEGWRGKGRRRGRMKEGDSENGESGKGSDWKA